MKRAALPWVFVLGVTATAQTPAARLWTELQVKRDGLPSAHQEFAVLSTQETVRDRQVRSWNVVVDLSGGRWRERYVDGFDYPVRVFDGKELLSFENGEEEYVRTKRSSKDTVPLPAPYKFDELEWSKATERRIPCETRRDHECVELDIPIKKWLHPGTGGHVNRLLDGSVKAVLDTATGLLLSSRTIQLIEKNQCTCRSEVSYAIKSQSYGGAPDLSLFSLPSTNTRPVKELPRWDAARLRKELVGKSAPPITVTDLDGNPVSLSAFQGKTVLLDFWASWCPPCRQDAPALQKLHKRYGNQQLAIIGISVSEDRKTVEKFLREHPAGYPIALSMEGELPRPYQVSTIPTYIVIDPTGLVQSAVQGDQGFGELRKLLKKAGLETD